MSGLDVYESFKNYENVYEKDLETLRNYICGKLTSSSPNREYCQGQYQLTADLNVIQWRKSKGFKHFAKKGEKICDGKLVVLRILFQ